MDAVSAAEQKAILTELRGLMEAAFAWGAWGRMLVTVGAAPDGGVAVEDILVEEIFGDEEALDPIFTGPEARASLPALANAVLALCLLDGLDQEDVRGGTFLQTRDGGLAFLSGLVRAPSPFLDVRRVELVQALKEKNALLRERYGIGAGAELVTDMESGSLEVHRGGQLVGVGEQVVVGSFALSSRSWAWGAHNPSLPEAARRRCADLLDALEDRRPWEISTPGFVTDEPTAWLLSALLAVEHDLDGVARLEARGEDGFVLVGLRALSPAAFA